VCVCLCECISVLWESQTLTPTINNVMSAFIFRVC